MNWNKLVPLSGVAAVLAIIASFLIVGETPDTDAPVNEVVAYYTNHDSDAQFGGALLALGAVLFLIYSSTLAGVLRKAQGGTGGSSAITFAGGIVFAVGISIFAGLTFVLGDVGKDIDPSAVQAIHALNEDLFFPAAAGTMVFLIGVAAAVLKTGALPKWLGWLAIVGVLVGLTPVGFFAIAILGIITLVSSVMLAMRADTA
jgi:hypothetical protein